MALKRSSIQSERSFNSGSRSILISHSFKKHKNNCENKETHTEEQDVNPEDCTFSFPPASFFELVLTILYNQEYMSLGKIWDFISGIFPYYDYHFTPSTGRRKVRTIVHSYKSFFSTHESLSRARTKLESTKNSNSDTSGDILQKSLTKVAERVSLKIAADSTGVPIAPVARKMTDAEIERVFGSKNDLWVTLDPSTKPEQSRFMAKLAKDKDSIAKTMRDPSIFDILIKGSLDISQLNLCHVRKRPSAAEAGKYPTPVLSDLLRAPSPELNEDDRMAEASEARTSAVSVVDAITSVEIDSSSDNLTDPALLTEIIEDTVTRDWNDDLQGDLSFLSNNFMLPHITDINSLTQSQTDADPAEIDLFEPKIISCVSLVDESFGSSQENADDPPGSIQTAASTDGNDSDIEIVGENFESVTLTESLDLSANLFANTVWSNDESSPSHSFITNSTNSASNSFPDLDKCIPSWTSRFPWMLWNSSLHIIMCTLCQEVLDKVNSSKVAVVTAIRTPNDVFSVSRHLRLHSEKNSHRMANIINRKDIISVMHTMLSYHFTEFHSVSDIVKYLNDYVEGGGLTEEMLHSAITLTGQYLEKRMINRLRKAGVYSVVADPCSGILIVRFLNSAFEAEEHVISSYSSVIDKNPMDYLLINLELNPPVFYTENLRCCVCVRCKNTKAAKGAKSSSVRLPHLDCFLSFLWKSKAFKPFHSLASSLVRLWNKFPHKFLEIKPYFTKDNVMTFATAPDVFIDIFENFHLVKSVSASIFSLTGNLDALGVQLADVKLLSRFLPLFPILTSINMRLIEIMAVAPFRKEMDNLCQLLEKFRCVCGNIKKSIEKIIDYKKFLAKSSDIDDLFKLVDITVKEFQQPIYLKNNNFTVSVGRLCCLENLRSPRNTQENLQIGISIDVIFKYMFSNIADISNLRVSLFKNLVKFLKRNPQCDKLPPSFILKYLVENPGCQLVFTFFRNLCLLPCETARAERTLYHVKMFDLLFYRSAWSNIGSSVREHLLTVVSELSNANRTISEKDMITWWEEEIFAKETQD